MKIRTLEYFVALAESNSINEAAQKLYIAQPSLTKSLQLFEEEIGIRLFIRKKSGIQLTEAGEKILPEAKQIVDYYNGWLTLSRQQSLRVVNIYIQYSFPNFLLPDVILKFKKRHPDIQVNCEVCKAPEQNISQDVDRPSLALFVCGDRNPAAQYSKLQGNPPAILFHGEYCCLVNKDCLLAGRRTVTPEALKPYYLALRSKPEDPATTFAHLLEEIVPVVSSAHVIQADSVDSIIKLVRAHDDVYALAYYPPLKRYEGVDTGELVYIPFEDKYKGDFCMFYSKEACRQHPILQELVKDIQKAASEFLMEAEA